FTYDVMYQNSVAPTVHNLVIDGTTTIPMSVKKTVGKMQEWEATSTLAPGPHTYTFQFGNGTNSWQLPLNSTPFSGPQVMPFKLTGIKVTPSNGAQQLGKPVVFNCIYTSPAGKTPVTAQINIDNNVHPMNAISGTPTKGIRYQYTTPSLSRGTHSVQLQFTDVSGLPTQQEYSVDVTPIYLQNSKVTPTSGTASTNFTFSSVYTGPGPATVVEVVVNGTPHPMSLVSGDPTTGATYSATLNLPAGTHNFALELLTEWPVGIPVMVWRLSRAVRKGQQPPWIVPDELWARIEPLLPVVPRRADHPGRNRLDNRKVLSGILFVLYTGIPWEFLPQELGFGSGMTCWRRLRDWQEAGGWRQLHEALLAELNAAGALDWSRAVIDSSHVRAVKGGPKRARARSTVPGPARSTT